MLTQHDKPQVAQSEHPLSGRAVQFFCIVTFGLVVPVLIWLAARFTEVDARYVPNTAAGATIAALASWYILDRLRIYAKARQLSYVVPVNLLTFGSAFAAIGLMRAPYSTSLFFGCLLMTMATGYVLTALTRLGNKPQYLIAGGRVSEIPHRGNQIAVTSSAEIEALIDSGSIQGSLVGDLHHDHDDEWERLFAKAALRGIPVYHYRQILELETGQVRIDRLSENVLGSLIPNLPYMALKRTLDVLAVIVLSPLLILLMAIIAIVIKFDSRGSVLFIQDRMGFRGEVFRMVKFRTMRAREVDDDALAQREDAMTRSDDDRITRVGRFLRKVRLDELPQAWNILKGEMSWIGPRPEAISLSEWYEKEIPFYSYRHIVRPGLTGWAQVNQGHVTDLGDANAKLRYDFYYVKNISHWLDMLIALKTIRVVLSGIGAK
ncbi:sugar transferase [Pontixanthobacter aquaemixtae]|uniref:Sugar transferase n=1 Tax=Pontixanthobacter aquaemixtae TaxID=1958940 RepID=A0A844ZV64_9SPHN|nr:sugar transferase [Pontixanthobacter aquaemixtae]MXO91364.1 sugar transferase [Pontixanthobacter aquaemixtae]